MDFKPHNAIVRPVTFDTGSTSGLSGKSDLSVKSEVPGGSTVGDDEEEYSAGRMENGNWESVRWIDDPEARSYVFSLFTAFYALVVTIFAFVLELSHVLSDSAHQQEARVKDLVFGLFMYGGGVAFFIYCYAVLINPAWSRSVYRMASAAKLSVAKLDRKLSSTADFKQQESYNSDVIRRPVFGVVGVVYYLFSIFLCVTKRDSLCDNFDTAQNTLSIAFVFIQMTIHGSPNVARWGTMHLVAANLWTWIRYVLIEERDTQLKIEHESQRLESSPHSLFGLQAGKNVSQHGSHGDSSGQHEPSTANSTYHRYVPTTSASIAFDKMGVVRCHVLECVLGDLSEVLYTCIVEYALIGAAVMFVVWKNVGRPRPISDASVKRKHNIRVDCSKSTTGLFIGLGFLAVTFVSMAVFYVYTTGSHNENAAIWVFGLTDLGLFLFSGVACIYGLYQMRQLVFLPSHRHTHHRAAVLLDRILLVVGLTGELVFSIAGLIGLSGDNEWQIVTIFLLLLHVLRLVQVGFQTTLLVVAHNLCAVGQELMSTKPGKQCVTFLLVANVSLFLMNMFESQKAGYSSGVVQFYGKKSWAFLVRGCAPLTIFYRFHSSVCFAEIWKHAYSSKGLSRNHGKNNKTQSSTNF